MSFYHDNILINILLPKRTCESLEEVNLCYFQHNWNPMAIEYD